MGQNSRAIHPVAAARTIPLAVAGPTVHCKVTNQQTPIAEARRLHEDQENQSTFCFACGRTATDYKCLK